ncbi:MAG: aminotransferase class IV [Candidatus Omnitrophota bacterium]
MGVFETMRVYNGRIVYFAQHLKRLKASACLLGLKFPAQLKSAVKEKVKSHCHRDLRMRVVVYQAKGKTGFSISARKYKPFTECKYKTGFSVYLSGLKQDKNSIFARIKSTRRALYEAAYKQARKKGFDEALILNQDGVICEASRSNIFLVKDNALWTPALACGCLPGITRKVIFDLARVSGIKVKPSRLNLADLDQAEEAFLTNSLIGVMPIKNKCGKISLLLQKKYNSLLA